MNTIHLEITRSENYALAHAVLFYIQHLQQQPQSLERDKEIVTLQHFSGKMLQEIKLERKGPCIQAKRHSTKI